MVPREETVKIKIRDGSTRSDKDVCRDCNHLNRRVDRQGERRTCSAVWDHPELLKLPIAECSEHEVKYAASVRTLEKIAWVLRTEKGGKMIGFTKYSDLSKEEQEKLGDTPEPGE